eukprot:18716_1
MSAVYFVLAHLCITSTIPYYISPNLLDWHQAEDFCAQHCNSNLASIHSEAQNNELIALIQNIASDPMINIPSTIDTYIGLIDSNGNGNWAWSDGSSFDYGNDLSGGKGPWDTSNPNSNSNPICVQIEGNDKWNDVECNDAFTPVIFACNSCDGVLTKTAMEETRDNYEDNKVRCANKFGTELLSFHSQSDWDEATRLCRLINEQSSIGLGPRGADLEDDCHIGLYLRSNGQITFDDGSTFYWPGDFGYPWDDTLPTQSDPCTRIKWDANPVYSLSKAWCSDNQWALCNMPSEICYQSRWTAVSGTGWSFNKPPCQVSNSYASNQNALIMLEDRRWNNNGQNIVFEMLYTMNAVNPSQSNTEPSTAGIVWHVDNSCANYYYFGISVYDDTVFIAQVKHGVVNVIHSQSLSFSYSTGTYYSLKVAVSASNRFSIYANSALLISNAAGSDDFSALDTTNGYIGIKNMRSSVIVKSLFVSGEPIVETSNDAATWFDACAVPTEVPTDDPTASPTERPSDNPTLKPSDNPTLKPSGNPTQKPSNNPTKNPTKSSTNNPTQTPTDNPTQNPFVSDQVNERSPSTDRPTLSAHPLIRLSPTDSTHDSTIPTSKAPSDDESLEANDVNNTQMITDVILVVICVSCVCMIVGLYFTIKMKRKAQERERMVRDSIHDTTHDTRNTETSGAKSQYIGNTQDNNQIHSMINGLSKVPLDVFVTKGGLETSGANDKVLGEIEGKVEDKVEMGCIHEGVTESGVKRDAKEKKEKTTIGSIETNTGITTKQTRTLQGEAIDNV